MEYLAVKCNFNTPIHIGTEYAGNTLADTEISIHSDTLFSALCFEAIKYNCLQKLYDMANEGSLIFSDMLPFSKVDNHTLFYIPKPITQVQAKENTLGDSVIKKKIKNMKYIPFSGIDQFLQGISDTQLNNEIWNKSFGEKQTRTHVFLRNDIESQPYNVSMFRFAKNCGLYFVLAYKGDLQRDFFIDLVNDLSISGIGGRRTSGLGKFDASISNLNNDYIEALNNKVDKQMLLNTAFPGKDSLKDFIEDSTYMLVRRGGFVASNSYSDTNLKKKTTYSFKAGSCFNKTFDGKIIDVSHNGNHPVWCYQKALFMGVKI